MAKDKTEYRCSECGWTSPKWVGQCRECQAWGTLEESGTQHVTNVPTAITPRRAAQPIGSVDSGRAQYRPTGVGELDRVLGGGIVPGAVILLAGEPGIGKSTLLLDVAARAAQGTSTRGGALTPTASPSGDPVLYITGEESSSQVKSRADRIGALSDRLFLADDNDLGSILGHIDATHPSLLVVDSIQTVLSADVDGGAGGVAQVRAVTSALIRVAKERDLPVIVVGHVTKDGGIAGPRVLEHLVDVVCQFEGERHGRLRLLRAVKNRYGPTDEVGCFELMDTGIRGLPDPSGLFLSQTSEDVPGSCVTVSLEGRRPMPTEIQALVTEAGAANGRRTTSGVDHSRVAMILAVLQARLGVDFTSKDVYVSTVGGAKTSEPAVDLAMAVALMSSVLERAPRAKLVAMGEIGLTGEVRSSTGIQRRLQEAARLGFTTAIVPAQGSEEIRPVKGIDILTVSDLNTTMRVALP
ncbi:DNA repair protein RadA [Schaalia sp. ZJ405]|uniref:DNA repair protein RadA n=1 Tax=Schaalia sp. ZJ405 TaxID=2709403 RepID=UPI0013EA9DEC|nr:DNA repair protein RadA [Schaalia sp. ZJ405]QPK81556.1 DNA repair protein RadA [Schaalia sp. ZJ405]